MDKTLYRATRMIDIASNLYRDAMEKFSHRWGDGRVPNLRLCVVFATEAAAMWRPLARALGYQIPDGYKFERAPYARDWNIGIPLPPANVTLKARNTSVFRCVQAMFGAHQWLENNYSELYPFGYNGPVSAVSRYNMENYIRPMAQEQYDKFDGLTSAIFTTLDAINLLNQLVIVSNRQHYTKPPNQGALYSYPPTGTEYGATFGSTVVTPFEVVQAYNKDPFITTTLPNEAVVKMVPQPITETELTYSDPTPRATKQEDEISIALRNAIQDAKNKLFDTRRLIGVVKNIFPWNWGWSAEDIAPDEIFE
jgi:hypothetical protein